MVHLAGRDQTRHRLDGLGQVDVVDSQPQQRGVAATAHVVRLSPDPTTVVAGRAVDSELRGHDDLFAPAHDRAAEQHLVVAGTVDVGRVPRPTKGGYHPRPLLPIGKLPTLPVTTRPALGSSLVTNAYRLPATMTVIGSYRGLPISDPQSMVSAELPLPDLRPHDVLVRVAAVSINPADVTRRAAAPAADTPTVLGFDAAGTVVALGPEASGYVLGDEVYYAGDVSRQGSNAEYHAVDSRIVGRKPANLTWAESAAVPLTTITAWEAMFDKFKLTPETRGTLLVVAGAGGVGSMLIQLAKKLTELTVIATASREESRDWAHSLGADMVVDHSGDFAANVLDQVPDGVDYIFSPYSKGNVENYAKIGRPFSEVCAIDGHPDLNLQPLMRKSITWHWEWMFTRSVFATDDITTQRDLLDRAAEMFESGDLRTTLTTEISGFTVDNLRKAHELVESGRTIGKVVVARG